MYQLGEWGGGRDGRRVRGRKHCICSLCGVWRLAASGTDPSAVRRPASCMHQWSPAQHEKGQLPLETRWQNDVFAAVYTEPASGSLSLCADIHRRASTFNLTKCQTLCCFTFRRLPCWEEGEHVLLLQLHGGSVVVFFFFFLWGWFHTAARNVRLEESCSCCCGFTSPSVFPLRLHLSPGIDGGSLRKLSRVMKGLELQRCLWKNTLLLWTHDAL